MKASEYPVDTADLNKGSRIPASEIEEAFGIKRDTKEYRLKLLQVRKYIEWRLAERGLEVVTRSNQDDIVILTDSEAAPFTDAEFYNTVRKLGRTLRKQASVDRAALTEPERVRHDRALIVNGATYSGTQTARKRALAPLRPNKRITPGKSTNG